MTLIRAILGRHASYAVRGVNGLEAKVWGRGMLRPLVFKDLL